MKVKKVFFYAVEYLFALFFHILKEEKLIVGQAFLKKGEDLIQIGIECVPNVFWICFWMNVIGFECEEEVKFDLNWIDFECEEEIPFDIWIVNDKY